MHPFEFNTLAKYLELAFVLYHLSKGCLYRAQADHYTGKWHVHATCTLLSFSIKHCSNNVKLLFNLVN